jgi:3-oxoacyl-[acyl-carrier-protein] synthase-3
MNGIPVQITAVGSFAPERRITNADLEKLVETSDDWIMTRTGIRERRRVDPGEATSDLAVRAARKALAARGVGPETVDLIILATITPDQPVPAAACIVQRKLGATRAWAFDMNGACAGFLFAMAVGAQFVAAGTHRRVLIVGADVMSSVTDYQDRTTCVLFGDGAGAALLEPAEPGAPAIRDFILGSNGDGEKLLCIPAGGSLRPASRETIDGRMHFVRQSGRQVFKLAVEGMVGVARELLARHRLSVPDIALFVPHQANQRILDAMAERLGLSPGKIAINIDRYGNTTAATIPLALAEAVEAGRIKKGDRVIFCTYGAGFTWGGGLVEWAF